MFCSNECWSCEDKSCEHYVSKEKLYFENKQLKQMVNFGGITITNCPNCKKEITINFCRETEHYRQKYLEQKDRINKAIDYIKINYCNREDINDCWHSGVSELLEILKGDFKCMK